MSKATLKEKQLRCIDLIEGEFEDVEHTWKKAEQFYQDFDNATEGEQIAMKVIDQNNGDYFHEYEDLYDYVNNTALSWDYVEPYTFENQSEGYYRLQLSWGGPSDEFRIYPAKNEYSVDVIEYAYMDWFDGAVYPVPQDSTAWEVCQYFLEVTR